MSEQEFRDEHYSHYGYIELRNNGRLAWINCAQCGEHLIMPKEDDGQATLPRH